jgi:hypothetical protein
MTKRAESVGLFIGSDGPNGSGNSEKTNNFNLFMKAGNPTDPVQYSAEGIKHFNNWKAGLSSLESTNKERFEFNHATEYLGYSFNAQKVKIVDELAAIAYPEYTDIAKIVWQQENGAIYPPVGCGGYAGYDVISADCTKIRDGGIFPIIDRKKLDDAGVDGYFDNLLILIEYDGYYTDSNNAIAYTATLDGKKEVFVYSAGPTEDTGKYYFPDGTTHKYPILNSKFGGIVAGYTDFDTETDVRIDTTQVVDDIVNLYNATYRAEWESIYRDEFNINVATEVYYGVLGYRTASIIKYAPAVECGRVDILHRKSGVISSVTSRAVATSNYHDLKSGDILKLTGALDSDSKDEYFNGIKYIQVNDSNTFTLFDDSTFLTRTTTSTLSTRNTVNWVLVGNIYDENRQGWSHKETLFSPTGRNGYTHSGAYGSETNYPLPVGYQRVETYYDLLVLDIEYDSDSDTALDPYTSNITPRNRQSRLDALWAGPDHYVTDMRFGSDIDFKKINGEYRLLVGEMGPDQLIDFENPVRSFPETGPYGKIHLFTLSIDVNKTVSVTVDESINASTGTSSAIATPPEMTGICDDGFFFYLESSTATRVDTATSQTYNALTQEYYCDEFYTDMTYASDDYWYGAMLYHLPDKFYITPNAMGVFADSDNGYFTDYNLCYLLDGTGTLSDCGLTVYQFYPYVDNFGKSVALDYAGGKVIAITGSTTKTDITVTAESTSCGPVHVFDVTGAVSSIQRINSSDDVSTPSGIYEVQANKARKFASCMVAVNGNLAFGKSKPYEIQYTNNLTSFTNEVSKIMVYRFSGSVYAFVSSAINQNDHTLTFTTSDDVSANYKELKLRDQSYYQDNTSIKKIWLTDRFGDCFDFNGDTIVTNAFDNYNDSASEHTDTSLPDSLCDYLHVYEKFDTRWDFVGKIAPSIDSTDTKYDYESFVYPNNYLSLRNLGNKNYSNSTSNSVTWDVDLTKCYALADDRIVLKDPLGYAIFSRNWGYASVQSLTQEDLVITDLFSYFKYSENFKSYDDGELVHTKFSEMYKYNETSVVKCYHSPDGPASEYKTPVYFMSVPTSITVKTVSFYVEFDGDPVKVRMLLYKNDPRLTLTINSDYEDMINGYETFSELPGDLFVVNKTADGERIFMYGALDSSVYHETTAALDQPYAKLITPTSISATNVARFDVPYVDLANYKIAGSKLLNTTRTYESGTAAAHKVLTLNDATRETYDSTVDIEDTLIVGFIIADALTEDYYQPPLSGNDIDYELTITDFDAVINENAESTVTSSSAGSETDIRFYDCIVDKVATYSNAKRQYNSSGKARYTNPILGLGVGAMATHNDQTGEDLVLEGTSCKSYQIFSIDNLDTLTSWEVARGSAQTWSNENYYEENRSFDISKLDYLSLYIGNNVGATGNVNLFISSEGSATGVVPLFISNNGATGSMNLYLENVGPSGYITLFMDAHTPVTGGATLVLRNEVTGVTNQTTLFLENTTRSGVMPLVMKTLDPTGVTSSHDLYIYGATQSVVYGEAQATIAISGSQTGAEAGMPLMIMPVDSGHANGDLMPLFINSFRDSGNSSEAVSIYIQNDDTVNLYHQKVGKPATLFLDSTYGSTGSMPLFLSRRGTSGQDEVGAETSLFVHNSQSTGNMNLFIDSAYGQTGSMNLFMATGVGTKTGTLNTFIRGYQDE